MSLETQKAYAAAVSELETHKKQSRHFEKLYSKTLGERDAYFDDLVQARKKIKELESKINALEKPSSSI